MLRRLRQQKGISAANAGHVDFNLGRKRVIVREVRAGWENSVWSLITIKKYHQTDVDRVVYVAGGTTVPTHSSPHIGIFSWEGHCFIDGSDNYILRVSGYPYATDVLHAEIVYEELE